MNHFLMPNAPSDREAPARYGDTSTDLLIEKMLQAGARHSRLVAGVFGGGAVVPELRYGTRIGDQNGGLALRLLQQRDIAIVKVDLGGEKARKIFFRTDNGNTLVHRHGEGR